MAFSGKIFIFEDTMSFVRIGVLVALTLYLAVGCNNDYEQFESSATLNFIRLNSSNELKSFFTDEANIVLYNQEGSTLEAHVFGNRGEDLYHFQFSNYVLNISLIKECINGDLIAVAGFENVNSAKVQNGILRFNKNGLVDTIHLKEGVVEDVIEYDENQYIVTSVKYGGLNEVNKSFLEKYTKGEKVIKARIPPVKNESGIAPIALIKSTDNKIRLFGSSFISVPRISQYTFNDSLELLFVNHNIISSRWRLQGEFDRSEVIEQEDSFFIYQKLTAYIDLERVIRRLKLNNEGSEIEELFYSDAVDFVIHSEGSRDLVCGDNFTEIDSLSLNNVFYALSNNEGKFHDKKLLGTNDLIHNVIDGKYINGEFKMLIRSRSQETLKDRYTIVTLDDEANIIL